MVRVEGILVEPVDDDGISEGKVMVDEVAVMSRNNSVFINVTN